MPRIKPFCAIKPAPSFLRTVVTRPLEYYGIGEARLIASENPNSFLHLINPALDNPYLRGSRQELVYKAIGENIDHFLEKEILITEKQPSIYIYQVKNDDLQQTGIWTLTHIDDYLKGDIRKHEHTVERREALLAEYIQQTNLDANPVLVTFEVNAIVSEIIKKYTSLKPETDFSFTDGTEHRIWCVNDADDLNLLVQTFAEMPAVYIADGHHRIASMVKMGLQKRKLYGDNGDAEFNYFSTVYMDTEEVKVFEYNRLIKDLAGQTEDEFLNALGGFFEVTKVEEQFKPKALHRFAMYLKSGWYELVAKPEFYNEDPVTSLDVSILQDLVLIPLLKVKDPRTDSRITYEGAKTSLSKLEQIVNNGVNEVVFVLKPITLNQLMAVADANAVMPPKSTWVEPKFLVGLMSHYFKK